MCIMLLLASGAVISVPGQVSVARRGRTYMYNDAGLGVDIRVMIPDTSPDFVVRGAILDGGSNQADINQMAFASRFGFCIGGVTGGGSNTYSNGVAAAVVAAFNAWALLDDGARPEFARIPFITTGNSAGGRAGYGIAMYAWQRTICFGINVSAGYTPSNPSDNQIRVPGMITIGEVDPLVVSANAFCDELVKGVRARGGLWSQAVIWGMSHETRRINHMFTSFYEHCIRQCYPESINPRTDPVVLARPAEASGWLAPQQSVEEGNFTTIAPFNSFTGNKATASWLLNEDIAQLYRGYTSKDIRLTFSTPDTFGWSGVGPGGIALNGPHWWSILCYQPGAPIELIIKDSTRIPGWTKIELYNGSTLIDSLAPGQPMRFTVSAADSPVVHAFNLLAYDNTSRVYPSILYSVFVSSWTPTYDPPPSTAVLPYHAQPAPRGPAPLWGTERRLYSLSGRSLAAVAAPWKRASSPQLVHTANAAALRLLPGVAD